MGPRHMTPGRESCVIRRASRSRSQNARKLVTSPRWPPNTLPIEALIISLFFRPRLPIHSFLRAVHVAAVSTATAVACCHVVATTVRADIV